MLFSSGLGWLLPITWLVVFGVGDGLLTQPYGISHVWIMWMATIALAVVSWIIGRSAKKEYVIKWRFNAGKTVRVSRHSFMFLPVEFWVWFAPVVHLFGWGVVVVLSYFNI